MVALHLILDGTVTSTEPFDDTALHASGPLTLIGMPEGTRDGRATVLLRFKLPDGRDVFAETTLRLLATAIDGLRARYEGH